MGIEAQVTYSSILLVREKDVRRKAFMQHINNWFWSKCWSFGSYSHDSLFEHLCILGRDQILAKQGKGIFASRMTDVIKTAFNKE